MNLLDKAIALDPQSGEAYVERGYLKVYSDLAAADADLRRGLELSPNYARGYEGLAAVMFQSVARRREALEMIEKARRLDPLAPHLDVLKATYLLWGSGEMTQAAQLLEAVLERDPLYVPAMVRLAEVRWCRPGQDAEAVALARAGGGTRSRKRTGLAAAGSHAISRWTNSRPRKSAFAHIADDPAYGWLWLHLYRKEWRKAGEAAYAMIAAGPTYPKIEAQIALAIRRHARVTGDYRRAIAALEDWASVSWEGDEPVLRGTARHGHTASRASPTCCMATGQKPEARRVCSKSCWSTPTHRSAAMAAAKIWVNDARAIAFALLGRPDEAMATLQRQARLGFSNHEWRIRARGRAGIRFAEGAQGFPGAAGGCPRQRGARTRTVPAHAGGRPGAEPELTRARARSRPRLAHAPGRDDLVRHRVPQRIEPLAAAKAVAPALRVLALRVRAEKEIARPRLVAASRRRTRDLRSRRRS